jgi:multisubunit Na+/H+ antiporter MnhC subunit
MPVLQGSISKPRWYLIPVRVLAVTFILALLSFAISLLLGIVGTVSAAVLGGVRHPNLTIAYRHIALPVAMAVAAIVIVSATVLEVRHYRQMKTLRRLEDQLERAR